MEENFIMILPEEIKKVGIHKALILAYLRSWLATNANNPIANRAGRTWSFQTLDKWSENTGVKRGTIKTHLKELRDRGIVLAGNFNKLGFDRTIWYSLADDYHVLINNYDRFDFINPVDVLAQFEGIKSTFTLDELEQMEIPNESVEKDQIDTTIQDNIEYNNEKITLVNYSNITINENEQFDNIITEVEDDISKEIEEFQKLFISVEDFIEGIDVEIDSDEKLSYHQSLKMILDRYGFDEGLIQIFNFLNKEIHIDDTQIQYYLEEIKSKRNRFLV